MFLGSAVPTNLVSMFSRMRSKGSRFTLHGSGGWGCVRSTLRSRSQPSATVRNRSQPSARLLDGRAYGKFCRRGHFWMFPRFRCFVSRGRRGTSWHSDVFCNVSKVVLCGRRNTFATFSEDALQFSWQAQHFGRVHRHFAWQAQHFRRVVLCVFCESHWLHQMATRCKFRGRRSILCDVLKIDGSLARNIDFEVANFPVLRKTRRTTSILKLQSVKIEGSLARNARFGAPRVSSRVSGFPVASPCLWGKLQNLSFSKVSMSFCVAAGVALCDIPTCLITCRKCQNWRKSRTKCSFFCTPTCLVSSRWFSCGIAVSMGEAARPLFFEGFQAGCHVVLRCRRGTLWHSNLFDNVSNMSKLEGVSHEMMLVFLHPRVSSRVSGFP